MVLHQSYALNKAGKLKLDIGTTHHATEHEAFPRKASALLNILNVEIFDVVY